MSDQIERIEAQLEKLTFRVNALIVAVAVALGGGAGATGCAAHVRAVDVTRACELAAVFCGAIGVEHPEHGATCAAALAAACGQ